MKNKFLFAITLTFLLAGCNLLNLTGQPIPTPKPTPASVKEQAPSPLPAKLISEEQAREFARDSDCVNQGSLKATATYNEFTQTWWIDLEIDKPGCNPACVVNRDASAEINWRCTGLIED